MAEHHHRERLKSKRHPSGEGIHANTLKALENILRIADYLTELSAARGTGPRDRQNLSACARWMESHLATYLLHEDQKMGRVAKTLERVEADRDAQKSRADRLQAQIDANAANVLDTEDLAALDKAEADLGGEAPPDTTAGGAGGGATPGTT